MFLLDIKRIDVCSNGATALKETMVTTTALGLGARRTLEASSRASKEAERKDSPYKWW